MEIWYSLVYDRLVSVQVLLVHSHAMLSMTTIGCGFYLRPTCKTTRDREDLRPIKYVDFQSVWLVCRLVYSLYVGLLFRVFVDTSMCEVFSYGV